jgi:hypothetical protein
MKLLSKIKHAELIHFSEDDLTISTYAGNIKVAYSNREEFNIKLPMPFLHRLFKNFRIFRRLFRIDKVNITVVNKQSLLLMIIYQGCVYRYDNKIKFVHKLKNGSSLLHNSIAVTPYGIYFGEYANYSHGVVINVHNIDLKVTKGDIVYSFPESTVKHIHSCAWDPYDSKIWILTGDDGDECKIMTADHNFNNISIIGQGGQIWRAVSIVFKSNYVYWFMDSPIDVSRVVKYSRVYQSTQLLQEFEGPIWYVKELSDNSYILSTVVEPGDSADNKYVYVYHSTDLENWKKIHTFEKDLFSGPYFKFSTLFFSSGRQSKSCFYISAQSIKHMDGCSYKCSI